MDTLLKICLSMHLEPRDSGITMYTNIKNFGTFYNYVALGFV